MTLTFLALLVLAMFGVRGAFYVMLNWFPPAVFVTLFVAVGFTTLPQIFLSIGFLLLAVLTVANNTDWAWQNWSRGAAFASAYAATLILIATGLLLNFRRMMMEEKSTEHFQEGEPP